MSPAALRPGTSASEGAANVLSIPSRTSSLHSRIVQPLPSTLKMTPVQPTRTLCYAYAVFGLPKEPNNWAKTPPVTGGGKVNHAKGAINQFYVPEVLGSSPRVEQDHETARSLYSAMRASFPHDVEVIASKNQPPCASHNFVIQQDSSHTLYGVSLRVWSRADDKRKETITELRKRAEPGFSSYGLEAEEYWIPYSLCFLSRYPLFNLLSDYLKAMWIHWNKATNLFHAEEVSRILNFPAPRLNDLVRIDMKDYSLIYNFPSSPTGFQNFLLWPLFTCLSVPNIVGVIEAALCPASRIIFTTHYPAMLTIAAETIRYCCRIYEWSGLYVPVVHFRNIANVVKEPGPYILGATAESRGLFSAPGDALLVDLDRNYVMTTNPPTFFTPGQRNKFIARLTAALGGANAATVALTGPPRFLREAYPDGKLQPSGPIIVMRGQVESIQDPEWWDADSVMDVVDHVCEKAGRNSGMAAIFKGNKKQPIMAKVSMRHLNEMIREKNAFAREVDEAWQDYVHLKTRMDSEVAKVTKRNNILNDQLEHWKQEFEKFQRVAQQLSVEAQELKSKIEEKKREARRLTLIIDEQKTNEAHLQRKLDRSERHREEVCEALAHMQALTEDLEGERAKLKSELAAMRNTNDHTSSQRDEALKVVLHLRKLIDGQAHLLEDIVQTLPQEEVSADESDVTAQPSLKPALDRLAVPAKLEVASRSPSAMSTREKLDGADVSPEMEDKFFDGSRTPGSCSGFPRGLDRAKRYSLASISDVADKSLKEKTSAIADIIKNISEQCARAVDTLHLVDEEYEALARDDFSEAVGPSINGGDDDDLGSTDVQGDDARSEGTRGRRGSDVSERSTTSVITRPTPDLTERSSTSFSNFSNTNASRHSAYTEATSVGGDSKLIDEEEDIEADDVVGTMASAKAEVIAASSKHANPIRTGRTGRAVEVVKAYGRPVSHVPVVADEDSDEESGQKISENARLSLACVGGGD